MSAPDIEWACWSVVLLKPDCIKRGLVGPVLRDIGRVMQLCLVQSVISSKRQIFDHYSDMFDHSAVLQVDMAAELERIYVGQTVVTALAYGENAADRLRRLIGDRDPLSAAPGTIRRRFGLDSAVQARLGRRLINNVIHTSDDSRAASREFDIWYGEAGIEALIRAQRAYTRSEQ